MSLKIYVFMKNNKLDKYLKRTFFNWLNTGKSIENERKTRAVLVFATERKNNVDPQLRSQKKVNNVQLFFAK